MAKIKQQPVWVIAHELNAILTSVHHLPVEETFPMTEERFQSHMRHVQNAQRMITRRLDLMRGLVRLMQGWTVQQLVEVSCGDPDVLSEFSKALQAKDGEKIK
jgi:hypothetical protein